MAHTLPAPALLSQSLLSVSAASCFSCHLLRLFNTSHAAFLPRRDLTFKRILCLPVIRSMSHSDTSSFSSSRLSIFRSPRPAPPPPSPSSDDIQGFVVPQIPPPDCPLHMVATPDGFHLPRVSPVAHSSTHRRVQRLVTFRINPSGNGHPCPPCAVLGIPDCRFADPDDFLLHLKYRRDAVFRDERTALMNAVHDNHLPASLFGMSPLFLYQRFVPNCLSLTWEYGHATAHFYSAAQGAIDRFIINYNATHRLSLRSYRALADSTSDAGLLSRFMSFGTETGLHRSVLQVVANRLLAIITNIVDPRGDDSPILPL
ncbi:hypothetical protein C8R45DRAFT_1109941 [Mycena sanguinolenta]|nr:hypothetical protein C8R45DRAFT_1109941 [Mycena sanguinolenta]